MRPAHPSPGRAGGLGFLPVLRIGLGTGRRLRCWPVPVVEDFTGAITSHVVPKIGSNRGWRRRSAWRTHAIRGWCGCSCCR